MSAPLFQRCLARYGDNPSSPAMRVACGKCYVTAVVHLGSMKRDDGDDVFRERMAARKFESMGWKVGPKPTQTRCPGCVEYAKNMRHYHAGRNSGEKQMNKVVPINAPGGEARTLSYADRRVIFAKLEEAYEDEQVGYKPQWSDQRVAEDLGVPVAWVKTVREENFGKVATNPDIERLIVEADQLREDARKIAGVAQSLKAQFDSFAGDRKSVV